MATRGWDAARLKEADAKIRRACSNMEQGTGNRKNPQVRRRSSHKAQAILPRPHFTSPVRLRWTAYGVQEPDCDGLCFKWFRDGLIKAGVLADDSPREVQESPITFVKVNHYREERFELEIEEIEPATGDDA